MILVMIYKIILLIFILIFCILYFKKEYFQNYLLIDQVDNNKNANIFNINKVITIPNTKHTGFLMNGINSYILLKDLDSNIFSISLLVITNNGYR